MAGLDPAIQSKGHEARFLDARVEPAHEGKFIYRAWRDTCAAMQSQRPFCFCQMSV
jgi:hypothetical protein